MQIFNNSPKSNRIHYKVDGKTFFFDLKGYETVDIPLLQDFSQIIGKYDRKTLELASKIDMGTLNGFLQSKRLGIKTPRTIENIPTSFDMRSVLSVAGQTRYDAVGDNEWFLVDRTDYEAVRAAAFASQYIIKDDVLYTEDGLNNFAAALHLTFDDSIYPHGAIPEGQRVIGYTYRTINASGSFSSFLRLNDSFKGGSGVQIGNTLSTSYISSTQTYILLKNATYVTPSKSYVIQRNSSGTRATTNFSYPMAYANSLPSWMNWTNSSILMQVIATELTPE